MITYETAEKLKEAGFEPGRQFVWVKEKYSDDWSVWSSWRASEYSYKLDGEDFEMPAPTLEELIQACGDEILGLHKDITDKLWIADSKTGTKGDMSWFHAQGKTPSEAVANLWLELNKK